MTDLYELLLRACAADGEPDFIRITARYKPGGASGSVIAPPTYIAPASATSKTPVYAFETRWIDGERRRCVRVDSVGSQANRLEAAIARLARAGVVADVPEFVVDLGDRELSSLEMSHRAFSAELANTVSVDGATFPKTEAGKAILAATAQDARGLLRYSPESLAFGAWDSHGRGSRLKLARAYTARMTGIATGDVMGDVRAAVKFDPLNLHLPEKHLVANDKRTGVWSVRDKPDAKNGVELSAVGLGSAPSTVEGVGGAAVEYVERVALLSFPVLRLLRFGPGGDGLDVVGRAMVAAYALMGDQAEFRPGRGCHLRSDCDLEYVEGHAETVGVGAGPLTLTQTRETYAEAVAAARANGLEVSGTPIRLLPNKEFAKAYALSQGVKGELAEDE